MMKHYVAIKIVDIYIFRRVNCKYVTFFVYIFLLLKKKKSLFIYQELTELEKPLRT